VLIALEGEAPTLPTVGEDEQEVGDVGVGPMADHSHGHCSFRTDRIVAPIRIDATRIVGACVPWVGMNLARSTEYAKMLLAATVGRRAPLELPCMGEAHDGNELTIMWTRYPHTGSLALVANHVMTQGLTRPRSTSVAH